MEQLATAFRFEVTFEDSVDKPRGIYTKVIQTKEITSSKKGFEFTILDEPPESPKEVNFFQAFGTRDGVYSHMLSLTDDLLFNHWFKAKENKKKKKEEIKE
jgi:hypothetical protein